jgi:dolichol kinase
MISELEIRRRIFHLLAGIIIVGLIKMGVLDYKIAFFILALAIALGLLVKRVKVPTAYWFYKYFDRPNDFKKLPGKGAIFYMTGVFLSLFLFEKNIAMASVLILAVGDSISAIVGQFGEIPSPFNRRKYIEGSIAGMLTAFIGAMLFVSPLEAGLASVAAMIAEGIDWKLGVNQLDDNIIMPVVAGGVIWILRLI